MTHRERFLATMRYQTVDRAPFRDGGAWPETIERWKHEGFDPQHPPFKSDPWNGFGHWFFPYPPFERTVVDEDENTVTYVKGNLAKMLMGSVHGVSKLHGSNICPAFFIKYGTGFSRGKVNAFEFFGEFTFGKDFYRT